MGRRRGKTWQVTEDSPTDLLIALYLRDAAGLVPTGDPSLPALAPSAVPGWLRRDQLGAERFDVLRGEWNDWWHRLTTPSDGPRLWELEPPDFPAFAGSPELRALIVDRFDPARAWAGGCHEAFGDAAVDRIHRGEHDINSIVVACERQLGRKAEPFHLDLLVLPLASRGIWIIGPNRLVVSTSLRDDSGAFREAMAPFIHALA